MSLPSYLSTKSTKSSDGMCLIPSSRSVCFSTTPFRYLSVFTDYSSHLEGVICLCQSSGGPLSPPATLGFSLASLWCRVRLVHARLVVASPSPRTTSPSLSNSVPTPTHQLRDPDNLTASVPFSSSTTTLYSLDKHHQLLQDSSSCITYSHLDGFRHGDGDGNHH